MNINSIIHPIGEFHKVKKTPYGKKEYFVKIFLSVLFLMLLFDSNSFCQTFSDYSEKYRYYRERFKRYFIYVGPSAGESLPFPSRTGGLLVTNDLPNHIGWYLGVLATEYKLTNDEGGDVSRIIEELYYALFALNRLDTYDAGVGNSALDGFLVRNDLPVDFLTGDHLTSLNKGIPYPGDYELSTVSIHNGPDYAYDKLGPNAPALSMDHYCRILMGLALVKKFVLSNETYNGTSLKNEAVNIADRIITYMKNGGWYLWMPSAAVQVSISTTQIQFNALFAISFPSINVDLSDLSNCLTQLHLFNPLAEPCTNCPLFSPSHLQYLVPRGCAPIEYCRGISKAGNFITGNNYNDLITDANIPIWELAAEKNLIGLIVGQGVYSSPGNLSQVLILAAIGDSWEDEQLPFFSTERYMHLVDQRNQNWRIYTLLHDALHEKTPIFDFNDTKTIEWLDRAPCIGPNRNSDYYYIDNMFETESITNTGYDPDNTGPGLDYMLFYNLWYINFKSQLPPYTTSWLRFNNGTDAVITNTNITLVPGNIDFPFNFPCPPCPFTDIGSKTHPVEIRALNTIYASNTINTNANVWYHAGQDLDFGDNFDVQLGAEWDASIDPVECQGGYYKSLNNSGKPDITVPMFANTGASNVSNSQNNNDVSLANNYDTLKTAIKSGKPDTVFFASLTNGSKNSGNPQIQADNSYSKAIVISPNPTTGKFSLQFAVGSMQNKNARLEITDVLGRTVFVKNNFTAGIANPIDLTNLQKGIYFLKVLTEDEVKVVKIVIK